MFYQSQRSNKESMPEHRHKHLYSYNLIDALMRVSAKQSLSELLTVSQKLSLALVIRHVVLKEQL